MQLGYTFTWAIILNFHRAANTSLMQIESYRQSPEKTKNNGNTKRETVLTLEFLEFIH